ncbi:hypothetical protein B0T18DRAFT_136726 [Schizothecium vesticola]|uniref:Zn(2)-C6 fungal-type domain-containing protein n=1 Tax=Schizothecium vesticola TaxID=314040 RepID=A0AA40EUN3_9PEZI|nr:hypothetical protein B0T18DRAFT_136726 [Schizothecium vesticola]
MVGVPGRSKGCHACRRRKKGCDLGRPTCARCRQAGIDCDGYERKWIFVHTDPGSIISKLKVLPLPSTAASTVDGYAQALPPEFASLARLADRIGCIATLWELQFPQEHACELATIVWVSKVQDEPIFQQSPCLQKAVLAVCLASIGKQHKTEWIIQHGLQLYGVAIKTLSAALSRLPSSTAPSDAMLVTTRVLAMHELISGGATKRHHHLPKIHAWPTHRMGELALLAARSPNTFVESPSHEMFSDARFMCTVAATVIRRGTILSNPDWKTIPWSKRTKTPRDLLLDIFVDLPSLLQQLDAIIDYNDISLSKILTGRCLEQATACERSLVEWLEFSAPEGWGMTGCPNLNYYNATPDSIRDAQLMCFFWTTYAQVLTVIQSLSSSLADANTDSRNSTILVCCQSIARTVPVFFVREAEAVGCYTIISFPMFFALEGLIFTEAPTVSADHLQLLDLFMKPARGGGSMAQFVVGMLDHSPVLQQTEAAKAVMTALAGEATLPP